MFKRLMLLFTHGPELKTLLQKIRDEEEERHRLDNMHRLRLCFKHRQEANHSHYAEHNCDHCKLLDKLKD